MKNYYIQNKEKILLNKKKWRQSPKGKLFCRIYRHNRSSKTQDLTIDIIQQVYENNIKKYGTLTCIYCLQPIVFGKDHLEHKIPLSRGGNNTRENLDIACAKCNHKKYTKTVEEFYKLQKL